MDSIRKQTPPRILVAEDEEMIRRSLAFGLTRAGYRAEAHANGLLAFEAFLERPDHYSMLITDVQMPLVDGFELVRRLRELRPELAVLVMTGYGEDELEGRSAGSGCLEFIAKPFRLEDILQRVRNAVSLTGT